MEGKTDEQTFLRAKGMSNLWPDPPKPDPELDRIIAEAQRQIAEVFGVPRHILGKDKKEAPGTPTCGT